MEPSSLSIYHTKNQQKWARGKKAMTHKSKGDCFYKNISTEQHIVYFQTPQKNP